MTGTHVLSLLCPTRNRPTSAERLADSVRRTASSPHLIEILFYIDSDDSYVGDYIQRATVHAYPSVRCIVGEPMSISKSWNVLAQEARGDVLLMANDDQIYITQHWDVQLNEEIAKFPDQIYCIYFNDGIWTEGQHCAFPIVSRKWIDTLGYFTPGIFKFYRNDTWIFDLAKRIGRAHYVGDILTEHLHPIKGHLPDSLFNYNMQYYDVDSEIWNATEQQREEDAELLRRAMT